MRNAMGLMAGPERPAVTLAILGRRVSASIAMARNVFTREMASAPASWATYAICAIEVTLGESLTMIGRDATLFAVLTSSSSRCGSRLNCTPPGAVFGQDTLISYAAMP